MLTSELHVLHQLDGAEVVAVGVADGHILHQHSAAAFVHPHRHSVGLAAAEAVDDAAHHRLHLRRMAAEDLAVDGHTGTLEDLRPLVEETIDVVGVDEGDFHRDGVQQGGELWQGEMSSWHTDFVLNADAPLAFRRGAGGEAESFLLKAFTIFSIAMPFIVAPLGIVITCPTESSIAFFVISVNPSEAIISTTSGYSCVS